MPDEPPAGGRPGIYDRLGERSDGLLIDVLKSSVRSHQWSATNLTAKAKSSLTAGAVVLSIAFTGIMAFSGLLGGGGGFWSPESAHPGAGLTATSLAVGCLALLSASIHFSIRALRTVRVTVPVGYGAFTDGGGEDDPINDDVIEAWASSAREDMRRKVLRSYIKELQSLERNANAVSRDARRGQHLPGLGLVVGVAASVFVMAAHLAAGAPAGA